MKTYATIATKTYGMGRICVVADHFSGYHGGYGRGNQTLWRKIFEWAGQCEPDETIRVGLLNYTDSDTSTLYDISPINVRTINAHNITIGDLSTCDVLYIIGSDNAMDIDCKTTISAMVDQGLGIIVEYPFGNAIVDALAGIEEIAVESVQRPVLGQSYWTVAGQTHYVYTSDATIKTFESLAIDAFDSSWVIVLATTPVPHDNSAIQDDSSSESSSSFENYLYHGIVETRADCLTDDSSSISSWSSDSSSSEIISWDVCSNVAAYWHLDDNNHASMVRDEQNLLNMGVLYHNTTPYYTNLASAVGVVNRSLLLSSNVYVATIPSTLLRFNSGSADEAFAVSLWVNISDGDSVFVAKKEVWSIGCNASKQVYITRWDTSGDYVTYYVATPVLALSTWSHIVVNAYAGSSAFVFIDNVQYSTTTVAGGYTGANTKTTQTCLGTDGTLYLHGQLDETMIFDRVLTNDEVKYLYNHGRGVGACQGEWMP